MSQGLSSDVIQNSMREFANEVRGDWPSIGTMNILMTGGTGFFGSWMLASFRALREAGVSLRLTVLSRTPEKFLSENPEFQNLTGLKFIAGDVATAEVPESTTHVFHFATTPTDRGADEASMRQTIVDGTRRMLEESVRVGAKRFMLASSGAVYGIGKADRPREENLSYPVPSDSNAKLTAYGAAKRLAEEMTLDRAHVEKIETIVVRAFAFGGPLFPIEGPYALSSMMSAMLRGDEIEVKSPSTIRSFLDGRDLVRGLWALLLRGESGEVYNLGSDESISLHGLAEQIQALAKELGRPLPAIVAGAGPLGEATDIYRPRLEKIVRHTAWRPRVDLQASLRSYAEWLLPPSSV